MLHLKHILILHDSLLIQILIMSQEIITEEETTPNPVPQELEEGRHSLISGDQRAPGSGYERSRRESTSDGNPTVTDSIALNFNLYSPKGPLANSIFLMVCMTSVLIEPLFLYIPEIKDDQNCFKLQNYWSLFAICFRTLVDWQYVIYAISQLWADSHKNGRKLGWLLFLVDIVITLPLPQVLVHHVMMKKMSGTSFLSAMNFFVAQHVLRIIRLYTLFRKAKTEGNLAGWAKVAFNLSYFHAGHVIGGLWYFYAVTRKTVCWRKVCINQTGCDSLSFYCNYKSGNFSFSNDFCSTNTENTTAYDFGIFRDAIQSGVLVEANLFKRFIACFRWGLQSLSCFGQGLSLSTNLLENIFVMSITISGVVLFFFLIGKVQMYVQSERVKSEERSQKLHELNRWVPFHKIDRKVQDQVKRYRSQEWRKTRGVDIEYLINILPEYIGKDIKQQLCLDLLKKVAEFRNYDDAALAYLCNHVRPVFYTERSYIIRQGDPIDQMLFVLQGKLWTYTSIRSIAGSSSSSYNNNIRLEDGDFLGEELVNWAVRANHYYSSNLPISNTTIQALTNVEAFVLLADDLEKCVVFIMRNMAARPEPV